MQTLKAWLKTYFAKTSLLILVPLNILIGAVSTGGFFIAIICIFWFFDLSAFTGLILGCAVIIGIIALFFVANYICYRACKLAEHYNNVEESAKRGKVSVKAIIIVAIFILIAIGCLLFDDLFLFVNGWWF